MNNIQQLENQLKAALEAAAKNSKIKVSLNKSPWNPENWYDEYFIDKESILNAYLENLIK